MSESLLRELQRWVAESVLQEHTKWRGEVVPSSRLLLGTLVYGRYVDRFRRYCVSSLWSRGNLRGLVERPLLSIHTDRASLHEVKGSVEFLAPACDVEVHEVCSNLDDLTSKNHDHRYAVLGASELIHMKRAFFRGMNYHCLFPDVVYPAQYFENLERLRLEGKKAVLSHSINGTLEEIYKHIHMDMPAARLASLALASMHKRQKSFVMQRGDADLPVVAYLVYPGRDRVSIAGMHANAVFLHYDLLGFAPLRLNTTLDAMLPLYIPEGVDVYMPRREDGMTLVELSDEDWTTYYKRRGVSLKEFALRFWVLAKGDRGFERILGLTTEFPTEGSPEGFTEDEVKGELSRIRSYVADIYPEVDRAFELGGILEEDGVNGPLYLPQERAREYANAR